MQNRLSELPAFYSNNDTIGFESPFKPHVFPLEIYDFTYLHFHDYLEIGYCVDGTGVCCVENKYYDFKKGDVQVIFPFQRHLSKNTCCENSRWYWVNINPYTLMEQAGFTNVAHITRMIHHEMSLCGIFSPEEYPEICNLVSEILHEISDQPTGIIYHKEMCAGLLYQLLLCLARRSVNLPKTEIFRANAITALEPAISAINQGISCGEIPSIQKLAQISNMSASHFRKIFGRTIGLSPKDYIIKVQLNAAERMLLSDDKSILDVSLESGFNSISAFNRCFKEHTGMTPMQFRHKYGMSN